MHDFPLAEVGPGRALPARMIRDWQPIALTRPEVLALRAMAEALYDPRGTGMVAAAFASVLEEIEAWLRAPDVVTRSALRALLVSVELSPVRFGFGARRMSQLPLRARVRYLAALDAKSATALDLWKTLLGSAYFAHPIGAAELGCATRVFLARGAS